METQARLIVDVARLDQAGEIYRGELSLEALDWSRDEYVLPRGGLHYDLFVQNLETELLVRGHLWQEIQCVCSRCAQIFNKVVEEPDFTRSLERKDTSGVADLTDVVREAIILLFPRYPVCRESCKGLCPRCGKNLNAGPCGCRRETQNPWVVLDALR